MAPDKSILTVISSADRNSEIQRRLQEQEVQSARRLLALATGSHVEAFLISKDIITKQILGLNGSKPRK